MQKQNLSIEAVSVSVVMPCLNEAENVGWVLERIPSWIEEVVLVDGHSTDGTIAAARSVRSDIVVVNAERRGKGAALRAGFRVAQGSVVAMIDADGSMDPAEIEPCVRTLSRGFDFVKGSRFLPGGGSSDLTFLRQAGNKGLLLIANTLYGTRFTDLCYGLGVFQRDALEAIAPQADGFEIETELVVKAITAGLRVREIASFEAARRSGRSNLRAHRDGLRVLRTLLHQRARRQRPRRSASPMRARRWREPISIR